MLMAARMAFADVVAVISNDAPGAGRLIRLKMDSRAVLVNILRKRVLTSDEIEREPVPVTTIAVFASTPSMVGQVGEAGVQVQLAKFPWQCGQTVSTVCRRKKSSDAKKSMAEVSDKGSNPGSGAACKADSYFKR